MSRRNRPLLLAALVFLAAAAGAPAQDFRIDTEVFVGPFTERAEKEPAAEMLTIFTNGMVYDFLLTEPREVTLFDPARGRITLLDESRKLKASLSTEDVLQYVFALNAYATQSKDPLFAFAARPQFETKSEEVQQNGQSLVQITLTGKPLSYAALGQKPQQAQAARTYRQFADWFARLNAARPGNLPPDARMVLNEALDAQGLLPLEVTRTITVAGTFGREKTVEVKSRHLVNWTLSGEDRKRIEHAGDYLVKFKPVSFDEYRTAAKLPESPKQARR